MQWGAAGVGCGDSFSSRILTESGREKDPPLLYTYHVPGTTYPFILTASCEVGIISTFFTDEESKSQRLKSCPRLVPELGPSMSVGVPKLYCLPVPRRHKSGFRRFIVERRLCISLFFKTIKPFLKKWLLLSYRKTCETNTESLGSISMKWGHTATLSQRNVKIVDK